MPGLLTNSGEICFGFGGSAFFIPNYGWLGASPRWPGARLLTNHGRLSPY